MLGLLEKTLGNYIKQNDPFFHFTKPKHWSSVFMSKFPIVFMYFDCIQKVCGNGEIWCAWQF